MTAWARAFGGVASAVGPVRLRTNLNADDPLEFDPRRPPAAPPRPPDPWEPPAPPGAPGPVPPLPRGLSEILLGWLQPEVAIELPGGQEVVVAPYGPPTRNDGPVLLAGLAGLGIAGLGAAGLVRGTVAAASGLVGAFALFWLADQSDRAQAAREAAP